MTKWTGFSNYSHHTDLLSLALHRIRFRGHKDMASLVTTTLWYTLHFRHPPLPLVLFPAYFQSPVSVGRKAGLALPAKNSYMSCDHDTRATAQMYTQTITMQRSLLLVPLLTKTHKWTVIREHGNLETFVGIPTSHLQQHYSCSTSLSSIHS